MVELGGFGNGEFEMTTKESAFLSNGQLYLYPSLTGDDGTDVFSNGGNVSHFPMHGNTITQTIMFVQAYKLGDCTNTHNKSGSFHVLFFQD